MISFLTALILGQQVDRAWLRSMQELLELNPAASVQLDLKDTLGRRTVFLDEQGKTLRTDPEFVRIFINPRLHLLVTYKKVDNQFKVFLIDRSGIRFQTEFKTGHLAKWIGDEFFVYGGDIPTMKVSNENGAPWHKEEWADLKTSHLIGGGRTRLVLCNRQMARSKGCRD